MPQQKAMFEAPRGFGGMLMASMSELNPLPVAPEIPAEWLAEFEAAARRPLATRMRYAFIKTYKPVLDDAKYRSWDSMSEYRTWCERELPEWLGYGKIRIPAG